MEHSKLTAHRHRLWQRFLIHQQEPIGANKPRAMVLPLAADHAHFADHGAVDHGVEQIFNCKALHVAEQGRSLRLMLDSQTAQNLIAYKIGMNEWVMRQRDVLRPALSEAVAALDERIAVIQ